MNEHILKTFSKVMGKQVTAGDLVLRASHETKLCGVIFIMFTDREAMSRDLSIVGGLALKNKVWFVNSISEAGPAFG